MLVLVLLLTAVASANSYALNITNDIKQTLVAVKLTAVLGGNVLFCSLGILFGAPKLERTFDYGAFVVVGAVLLLFSLLALMKAVQNFIRLKKSSPQ